LILGRLSGVVGWKVEGAVDFEDRMNEWSLGKGNYDWGMVEREEEEKRGY
jgi:hypothetical protein